MPVEYLGHHYAISEVIFMNGTNNKNVELLEKENQLLREIIDRIHEPVSVSTKEGVIVLYNSESEKSEGMKRENVLGKHERDIYPDTNGKGFFDQVTKKVIETGRPLIEHHCKYRLDNERLIEIFIDSYPFFYQGNLEAVYNIGPNVKQGNVFVSRSLELQRKVNRENNTKTAIYHNGTYYSLQDIVGRSEKISKAVLLARKIAGRTSPILIYGETGTGKELFAQGIHNASLFAEGSFIAVNCAAIPETLLEGLIFGTSKGAFTGAIETPGLFEQAEEGTLFLDEIDSMPISLQAKLLRVLQDKVVRRIGGKQQKPINCRIISATNMDPFEAVKKQRMREDLFYRLATVTLGVPPLRERKEDIALLVQFFIDKYNRLFGLYVGGCSEQLTKMFEEYHWPGNVRELENTIESAINCIEVGEKELNLRHVPPYIKERFGNPGVDVFIPYKEGKLHAILMAVEKRVIKNCLDKNGGNVTKTAEELGVLRQALHYRIRKFGLYQK